MVFSNRAGGICWAYRRLGLDLAQLSRSLTAAARFFQTPFERNRPSPRLLVRWRSEPMRKIITLLDEEQRKALRELLDFGTAVSSAGLVVAALKGFVDLVM